MTNRELTLVRAFVRFGRALATPELLLRKALRRFPALPVSVKLALDVYERPDYAYGLFMAAQQAGALGVPRITSIEFGVGRGEGLLAMEALAPDIEAITGISIDILGFDTGGGLPPPKDYRDLPYLWEDGSYAMNEADLRSRLTTPELVTGDVAETVPAFLTSQFAPIGFIAFDLDYYSSTIDAFAIFATGFEHYLPRLVCYFDDVSHTEGLQSTFTGEGLAIQEFNVQHPRMKIGKINGLSAVRVMPGHWHDLMYACHFFDHELYTGYIGPQGLSV